MDNYINIGRIAATFGIKGEIILKHALGKKTTLKGVGALFIEEIKGSYLPYFIQSAKIKDDTETYVTIEGITSKEAAHRLLHKNVWLPEDEFRKLAEKTAPISLLGYTLINEGKTLGPVEQVIEQPHQVLLSLTLDDHEVLIPLHEETLDKIDRQKKEVHVTLPDGLLDIYR
jgi:16S rRNA processing protein RimM